MFFSDVNFTNVHIVASKEQFTRSQVDNHFQPYLDQINAAKADANVIDDGNKTGNVCSCSNFFLIIIYVDACIHLWHLKQMFSSSPHVNEHPDKGCSVISSLEESLDYISSCE